jgi:elongation factor P
MKINATEIRVGMILNYKNDLWEVLKTNHVKPGKGGAFAQVEMKSLNKNTKLNERFRSNETVDLKKNIVGEKGPLLSENLEVTINFHDEKPLSVMLPNQITCKIETTDVALKGQTVSSSYKPATLDNGINIQVPPFIESGDTIILDTRTMDYIKKV